MKGYDVDGNPAVIKMANLSITGNIINLNWFKHIKMDSGKPDAIAILLLSDIVYWYRPIEVRDEMTGDVIEMRKKFAANKLQRSYGAFAELYGFTKDQVKDALKRLESKGLIDLDFQHPVVNGQKLGNVLYIGLNVDRLKEITTPLPPLKHRGYEDKSAEPPTFKDDTNTEITPETTTENAQEEAGLVFITNRNPLYDLYESSLGALTPPSANWLDAAEKQYSFDWVVDAIGVAAKADPRPKFPHLYCASVLDRWKREGREAKRPGKKQTAAASGDKNKYLKSEYAEHFA